MNQEVIWINRAEIGQRVFEYIKQNGYTKLSFAEKTGISRPTLDKVIEGAITNPKSLTKHLEKISESIGYKIDVFLQDLLDWREPDAFQLVIEPHAAFSDRVPIYHERPASVQNLFSVLEDLYWLADLYLKERSV